MLEYFVEGFTMFVVISVCIALSRTLIRKVPVLAESRAFNLEEDSKRMAMAKYPPVIRQNQQIGLLMFPTLIILVTPYFTSFEPLPWWRYITDILAVYCVYDFLYYLMHRFLFHGNKFFKRIHGLHHQARNPSHIDAQYVHPLETFMGLALLWVAVITVGLLTPGDFHVASMIVCFLVYSQINILNHADVQLSGFPWSIATWISKKHHNHHIDMSHGNYATIILLFDWMFGTFE